MLINKMKEHDVFKISNTSCLKGGRVWQCLQFVVTD